MSNTTAKVRNLIALGYSLLASQVTAEQDMPSVEEHHEENEALPVQDVSEENILPDTRQVVQTLLPNNPTATLRI